MAVLNKVKERLQLRLDRIHSELYRLPLRLLLRLAVLRNPVLEGFARAMPPVVELRHSVVLRCLEISQPSVVEQHLVIL